MPFDHFDFLAPFYDRAIRATLSPDLLQILDPTPGSLVLDAAGGTGRLAQPLLAHAAQVIVVDLAFGMLSQARRKNDLAVARASTSRLPFPSQSFDRILMVDALHHIRDQAGTVQELWQLLKPGGRLVIEEPDITAFPVKIVALIEILAGMGSRFLRLEQIASLVPSPDSAIHRRRGNNTLWVWAQKT